MNRIKQLIKQLIKDNNLCLEVKNYSDTAVLVTDWDYWYHFKTYQDSDLKKFEDLIKGRYKEINAGVGGSICIRIK